MKTKQQILAEKESLILESMKDVFEFIEKNYEFEGQVLKYNKSLTDSQMNKLNDYGFKATQKDNGADKYGYQSWIEIS